MGRQLGEQGAQEAGPAPVAAAASWDAAPGPRSSPPRFVPFCLSLSLRGPGTPQAVPCPAHLTRPCALSEALWRPGRLPPLESLLGFRLYSPGSAPAPGPQGSPTTFCWGPPPGQAHLPPALQTPQPTTTDTSLWMPRTHLIHQDTEETPGHCFPSETSVTEPLQPPGMPIAQHRVHHPGQPPPKPASSLSPQPTRRHLQPLGLQATSHLGAC